MPHHPFPVLGFTRFAAAGLAAGIVWRLAAKEAGCSMLIATFGWPTWLVPDARACPPNTPHLGYEVTPPHIRPSREHCCDALHKCIGSHHTFIVDLIQLIIYGKHLRKQGMRAGIGRRWGDSQGFQASQGQTFWGSRPGMRMGMPGTVMAPPTGTSTEPNAGTRVTVAGVMGTAAFNPGIAILAPLVGRLMAAPVGV